MASLLISSILKATTNWLSLISSTSSTSSAPSAATVADDLDKMQRMLKRIQAVLLDAEEREIMDESVKLWLKELKDVAYDAEDLVDEYNYQVLRAQVEVRAAEAYRKRKRADGEEEVTSLYSATGFAVSEVSILSSMADRIKNTRKRFKEISKDRDSLHLKPEYGERRCNSSIEHPPPSSHMVNEVDICGRNDEKKKLLDWLFSNKGSKFGVLAVVGKGGLGKTTLAQLVYNDPKVSDYFQQRMWIYVSNDFDLNRMTRAMIESVTKAPCALSEFSLLQESLLEKLQGKTTLLVLDDVWNENKELWGSLRISFHSAEMVRIIVTTRNVSVAEVMQTTDPCHLGSLPDDQCWQLFVRRAFGGRDIEQLPNLVEIGRRIVDKCGGLPVAVKSLGGLLHHETDEERWKDVLVSDLWELDEETDILPALKLSYNRMPSHLKPCFVICSMFPKDHLFRKDELIKLWVAQGYIQHKHGKRVDEVGHKYFNELHRRSFFDKDEGLKELHRRSFFDEDEGLKERFKMHDNIHDLAQYISGTECSALVKSDKCCDTRNKIHHLSIDNELYDLPLDAGALRTLILYKRTSRTEEAILLRKVPEQIAILKQLRYLKLQFACIPWYPETREPVFSVPEGIENLTCLRHFSLETHGMIRLPKSIIRLYNLKVLEVRCHQLEELPETIGNLISLEYLVLECYVLRLPSDISKLEVLNLLGCTMFFQLPTWIDHPFFSKLTRVHLSGSCNDRLPTLGQLPFLKYLSLKSISSLKRVGNEFSRGMKNFGVAFPSLIELKLEKMPDLKEWSGVVEGDFPELQELIIKDCPNLSSIPALPNLKSLDSSNSSLIYLPPGFGKVTQLERLRGQFGVRIDDVAGILKNLVNLKGLIVKKPGKFHYALKFKENVDRKLVEWNQLRWRDSLYVVGLFVVDECYKNIMSEDEENDGIEKMSFFVLENLKHHIDLVRLYLKGYHGVKYPSWIDHPSFNKLAEVHLCRCRNDQLPTFGQLPSLKHLTLDSISSLKIIGYEFCRGGDLNEVAFPSLVFLKFLNMPDWEEWFGVLEGDFPQLKTVRINGCPALSSLSSLRNLDSLVDLSITECPALPLSDLNSISMLLGWIGHSPFNKLTKVCISSCCSTDHLPTFGQLPSLRLLSLKSICGLKIIGDEFCRGINSRHEVAFPSLTRLDFEDMPHWEEWCGLRSGGDFLQLESLRVEKCPSLYFFPPLSLLPPKLQLDIIDCPRLLL